MAPSWQCPLTTRDDIKACMTQRSAGLVLRSGKSVHRVSFRTLDSRNQAELLTNKQVPRDIVHVVIEKSYGAPPGIDTSNNLTMPSGGLGEGRLVGSRPGAAEVAALKVCGETHYLWRAVDQDGNVLDILVQSQRNAKAATRFFKKLLKGLRYAPRVMITDELASYGAARKQMRLSIEHRQHKGLNNRAENSHQPTRQKERQMKKFKSPGKGLRVRQPSSRHW